MENKISIEKVIDSIQLENGSTFGSYISKNGNIYEIIEKAMMKFGQQLLELAAENADLENNPHYFNEDEMIHKWDIYIDKQSILDTIKQVE